MKRLLYIACVEINDISSGITRKVVSQYKTIDDNIESFLLGYWDKDIKLISKKKEKVIYSNGVHRRIAIIKNAAKIASEKSIDYVYIRRFPCNQLVIGMLKRLKKVGVKKIIWEIPTYPYDYEAINGVRFLLERILDKHYRKQLKKHIDRIVSFSNEKEIFGVPVIYTGNGIDVDSIRIRKIIEHGDEVHLIAAAILNEWHGYDRLIKGLAEYDGERKVVFHLVGDGPCFDEYQQLANELDLGDRIIFYGAKTKTEMEEIYDICDIGVESLGWHRINVRIGTSLKTREYVAKGLPILASSAMDIFPEGWEYAYYAPVDESPIDIDRVIEFYDSLYINKSKRQLADEIRQIAYERCDMKMMMKPIIDFYNMN